MIALPASHRFYSLLFVLAVFSWSSVQAQWQLSAPTRFNHLTLSTTKPGGGNPKQFTSAGVTAGSAGPISTSDPKYPQGSTPDAQGNSSVSIVLRSARAGNAFATGVPRYYFGDQILPPVVQADNVTPATPGYWRSKPVLPDESFTNPDGSNLVDVTGANLLDPASSTGKPLAPGESEIFYYSPHADKVFATQAGTVEILWVSSVPEGAGNGAWKFRKETFNVSGSSQEDVRKIYWTEKSFSSPRVQIPVGRIDRVNPIYSNAFPSSVAVEYVPVGEVINPDPNAQPAEEKRTLWFEKINGNAQLAAYNKEGRIFVEYLGEEVSPGRQEFLGADVVEVSRKPGSEVVETKLGHRVLPRDIGTASDTDLLASPVLNQAAGGGVGYYGTSALPDGRLIYYAERENLNPDRVIFYWLEENDAGIHYLSGGQTPGLSIYWPKYEDRYRFVWPTDLSEFAHVTTNSGGSTAATGLTFEDGQPEIIFQDDRSQTEASFDEDTQRLMVDLSSSTDDLNRTLLKFTSGNEVWYQALYSQADDRQGYEEPDGEPQELTSAAVVGSRIERPSDKYSLAGYISNGRGYQASAYIDPYTSGITAAETGAIIPVNALPSDNKLTVRWFEKIEPPSAAFSAFYVPSKVGRYTVSYPGDIGQWAAAQALVEERGYHSSTVLQDGRVMVAGGFSTSGGILKSVEIYDPATGGWKLSTPMNVGTWGHAAITLANGKVLVAGGGNHNRAEIFDSVTEQWTLVAPMNKGRAYLTGTLLADGSVLVVGGTAWNGTAFVPTQTAELYNPMTGMWETVGDMAVPRMEHTATLLADGRVLVTGGKPSSSGRSIPNAEVYDPVNRTWTSVMPMAASRAAATATRLEDGKVLIAGGFGGIEGGAFALESMAVVPGSSNPFVLSSGNWQVSGSESIATANIGSPVLRVSTAGPVTLDMVHSYNFENTFDRGLIYVSRNGAPYQLVTVADQTPLNISIGGVGWTGVNSSVTSNITLFADGKLGEVYQFTLVANWDSSQANAGLNWDIESLSLNNGEIISVSAATLGSAELYDPDSGNWTTTGNSLTTPRVNHRALMMGNGRVLVTGGYFNRAVELYDPAVDQWSVLDTMTEVRAYHGMSLLQNGQVLVTGGRDFSTYTRSADILGTVGQVVMASNEGTSDLTQAQAAGVIYQENNRANIGFNPNEEHAVKRNNRFYALRDDLNVVEEDSSYTSEPFVLVAYTDPADGRPAMRPFKVLRETSQHTFNYPWTAGTKIQGPMPLPLMQLPLRNGTIANTEVPGTPDPAPAGSNAPARYASFTLEDRQGYKWVYRGTHNGGTHTLGMQWYYPMDTSFFVPGVAAQPAVGTALPYLRPLTGGVAQGDPVSGTALTVVYRPAWPESVPTMRVAETLTLPKFGLPDVRNQKSAEVYYQQSIAKNGTGKNSVTLHDPTRQKAVTLIEAGLTGGLPKTIRTSVYQGKTYFQGLPPHLQTRFYLDPLASATGSLIFKGEFFDEIAGEDYLDLNVLSAEDQVALVALAENEQDDVKAAWTAAISKLKTRVETFIEDPSRKGTYVVSSDQTKTFDVGPTELAVMPDSDAARDSYALTATGQGEGYVTLVFSDGENPDLTPQGDPPAVKIIRILSELYTGDLKVRLSSNPLDEKVTLRHSGDFAAKPEDYQFEWRYAPPTENGTQPPTYSYTRAIYLGDPGAGATAATTRAWKYRQNPTAARPPASEYSVGDWSLPRSISIRDADHDSASGLPGLMLKSTEGVDFAAGIPAEIVFSADIGALDGFALYVNGVLALVHGNGVEALEDLISGEAYDLRLMRAAVLADLPVEGESLVVVAEIDSKLHFRIFDAAGERVFNAGEDQLSGKSSEITTLKGTLSNLWATTNLLTNDKVAVVSSVAEISGVDLDQDASTGLSNNGLSKQFRVDGAYFVKGVNQIEVALYTEADGGVTSSVNLRLEGATKNDQVVAAGSSWTPATGTPTLMNRAIVGGSPTAPLGSPLLVMSDNYFTMRYRPLKTSGNILAVDAADQAAVPWSDWTRPALVEGWIKRVLAAINPFNQRMTDLYNNAVNTDVSLITQAGGKWEGDIALTLDAVNDAGLIEIYETVLNRGKGMSIESGYDYGPANDALLLAAGYLSDLYTILGDEAYADAANPTISLDDQDTITEVTTSRFSFEGQVASVLDEELALLRGRDDFLTPQVTQSPFYNRMFWNYTRGINSGEALYAVNYNIKEKLGSSTADGVIDAADAQRMFPQGHGDAYGHYLTALKGYYKLLTKRHFTWKPRIEALNILGNTVSVDYQDERKFAESAAKVAAAAEQVVALTHRQQYHDDPADGWEHFRDGKKGGEFNNARHWGLDEWVSRSGQGAYYHWVVGNAMVPEEDTTHTGIQKIDRTTVLELQKLPVSGESFQVTLDNASTHLNPLGLSPGAIAFDISPAEMQAGNAHYEQIYGRALNAVLNAKGSFDQAGRMTRLLRNQENQIDEFNVAVDDQETAYTYALIDIYGTPFAGDIGPGKTYAQGYTGPDLINWFVVDRTTGVLVDTGKITEVVATVPKGVPNFAGLDTMNLGGFDIEKGFSTVNLKISSNRFVQFSDVWRKGVDLGQRSVTGRLQQALLDAELASVNLLEAEARMKTLIADFGSRTKLALELVNYHERIQAERGDTIDELVRLGKIKAALVLTSFSLNVLAKGTIINGDAVAEAFPKVAGLSVDATSVARAGVKTAAATGALVAESAANAASALANGVDGFIGKEIVDLEKYLSDQQSAFEEKQFAYEYSVQFNELKNSVYELQSRVLEHQQAAEAVRNVIAEGDRIQIDREIYRKRAATVVQGYRTKDLTFRVFRNEALEQYRTLFDLASRYTYLAAKSYDYETGLLGSAQGQTVFNDIVASRSLGDLTNGVPQSTVSTLGDSGLAGTMAQMNADFSVAEGRLGINNPDQNGTLFSLRRERYRLLDDPALTSDDDAWQQTLEQYIVSDVLADSDVAAQCRNIRKPDGSPVPGIIIPFTSTIEHGKNYFGLGSAAGDHNFSPSNYATKIFSVGVVLPGYVGMDPYAFGSSGAGSPNTNAANALNATPYLYLIPVGMDRMLAPPLGDTNTVREWKVDDQALPLPYNLGATAFNGSQFFNANGTLSEQPWIVRKHQAFRPVDDPAFFYSRIPQEFTNSRLIGRSVWNTQWKIVIPAYSLLEDEQEGLDRFAASVKDIQLFLRTYSNSGN